MEQNTYRFDYSTLTRRSNHDPIGAPASRPVRRTQVRQIALDNHRDGMRAERMN